MLPDYIAKAVPNPPEKRAPWYVNTAPSYAGVFLWVAFYESLGRITTNRADAGLILLALLVAGLLSFALYYYVPAMLGMKTGYPLYVVGSSTFGTRGGYAMPGLLMGLLQVGWFAVSTFFSTKYILSGFGSDPKPRTLLFAVVAILWGYTMALMGVMGIKYVARIALFLSLIPLLMVLLVFLHTRGGLAGYAPKTPDSFGAFTALIAAVIGFFATAGAAGADFGMNNRDARDVRLGGLVGIVLPVLYAAGLPILSVAAMASASSQFTYSELLGNIGTLGTAMFFLFAIASVAPTCFCAFIAGNSFSTMIPRVSRMASTMAGVTVSIVLAITGVAADLIGFFTIVGASFGPICGAMAADYLLSGKRWAGPRSGINWPGYIAWALGFLVGIIPFLPVSAELKRYAEPAVVYSFIVGFLVYAVLAKAGLEPKTVPVSAQAAAAGAE